MNEWKFGDFNKTDLYILPMLGGVVTQFRPNPFNIKMTDYFPLVQYRNAFLGDKTKHGIKSNINENQILLCYKIPMQSVSNIEKWIKFETDLMNNENFVGDYKPDKFHQLFIYDVPVKWSNEYNLFKEWKPSKFSKDYKEHIRSFYGNIPDTTGIMGTLYKTEERFKYFEEMVGQHIPRDLEASSEPYWEQEYYIEEFKQKSALLKATNQQDNE